LIEKLGLPATSKIKPLRKQLIKGKEVEQPFQGPLTCLSPSTFNQNSNAWHHHHHHHHHMNFELPADTSLGNSLLNRNPHPGHPNHMLRHLSSSFLLGPPPRALSINSHHSLPCLPTPSLSKIQSLKPSATISPLRHFSASHHYPHSTSSTTADNMHPSLAQPPPPPPPQQQQPNHCHHSQKMGFHHSVQESIQNLYKLVKSQPTVGKSQMAAIR
jgi:hypothetical protein